MAKAKKIVRKPVSEKLWTIFLSNGQDSFTVHYRKDEIGKLFPDARIIKDRVYL